MSKSKVGLTPDKISGKWGRNLKHSVPDIITGLDGVTESPMAKAVEKKDKMLQNLTAAVQDGTWEKRLLSVSLEDWKKNTKEKVTTRMAGGVDAAMPKRKKFDSYLVSELNAVLPEIAGMRDMTLEDSKARVGKLMDHMAAHPYKKA